MATNSTAITEAKRRWERAEFLLEVASVLGGLMVGVGLWIEGESSIGQRLVTAGVAMEVICAWWVLVASRKLQNILETEFEKVRLETARATERAAGAEKHAAEARLELEKYRAPRIIQSLDKVIAALKNAIGELSGRLTVQIFVVDNDDEVIRLRDQFFDFLLEAGWRVGVDRRLITRDIPTGGVTVRFQPGSTIRQAPGTGRVIEYNLAEKAKALVSAFRDDGGIDIIGPYSSSDMVTAAEIEIVIGNKPRD